MSLPQLITFSNSERVTRCTEFVSRYKNHTDAREGRVTPSMRNIYDERRVSTLFIAAQYGQRAVFRAVVDGPSVIDPNVGTEGSISRSILYAAAFGNDTFILRSVLSMITDAWSSKKRKRSTHTVLWEEEMNDVVNLLLRAENVRAIVSVFDFLGMHGIKPLCSMSELVYLSPIIFEYMADHGMLPANLLSYVQPPAIMSDIQMPRESVLLLLRSYDYPFHLFSLNMPHITTLSDWQDTLHYLTSIEDSKDVDLSKHMTSLNVIYTVIDYTELARSPHVLDRIVVMNKPDFLAFSEAFFASAFNEKSFLSLMNNVFENGNEYMIMYFVRFSMTRQAHFQCMMAHEDSFKYARFLADIDEHIPEDMCLKIFRKENAILWRHMLTFLHECGFNTYGLGTGQRVVCDIDAKLSQLLGDPKVNFIGKKTKDMKPEELATWFAQ